MSRLMSFFLCAFLVFFLFTTADADDVLDDFTFQTLDGTVLDSENLTASPLVISIVSPACSACRREAPEVQKAYLAYRKKGVIFLGVFIDGTDADIKAFVESYNLSFPVGRDNGIAKRLRVRAVPVTTFVARGGKIVRKHFGATDYSRMIMGIEEIL